MFKFNIQKVWNPEEFRRQLLEKAMRDSLKLAEFILERAIIYCPYDESKPSDQMHLRDTLHIVSEASGLIHHVIATAPWAEPVEFGYRHWRSRKWVPPVAYLRRAVNDGAREYPRIIGDSRVKQGFHHGRLMGVTIRAA